MMVNDDELLILDGTCLVLSTFGCIRARHNKSQLETPKMIQCRQHFAIFSLDLLDT